MKISKSLIYAAAAMAVFSCNSNDDDPVMPKGAYENGILISNEGNFGKPNASVSFTDAGLQNVTEDIFSTNNGGAPLGDVLQSISFSGGNAYLVMNASNKIEMVDRYTFKKKATITSNLSSPRYMAFSGNYSYVTNNDFFKTKNVAIYSKDNNFIKSINFDRYAEKITEAGGYIYVQTDGVTYDDAYQELPTGHNISRINASTNNLDKPITLTDSGIIRDMLSANGIVYVLSSDKTGTNLYKINGTTANTEKVALNNITGATKMALDNGRLYFLTSGGKVFSMPANGTATDKSFDFSAGYAYGFNVIDGNVYIADSDFVNPSKISVYSTSGALIKSFKGGMGTNGFYKN